MLRKRTMRPWTIGIGIATVVLIGHSWLHRVELAPPVEPPTATDDGPLMERRGMLSARLEVEEDRVLEAGFERFASAPLGETAGGLDVYAGEPAVTLRIAGRKQVLRLVGPLLDSLPAHSPSIAGHDRDAADLVMDGRAELAVLGQPLSENERAAGLVETRIGWFAPVLAVPRGHAVHGLPDGSAEEILRGRLRSWAEVGGEDRPIDVLAVEPGPLGDLMTSIAIPGDRLRAGRTFGSVDLLRATLIGADPQTSVAFLPWPAVAQDEHARALTLGRIRPSDALIKAGGWPWAIPLSIVYRSDNAPLAGELVDRLDDDILRVRLASTLLIDVVER
jgi:hypothetical protein